MMLQNAILAIALSLQPVWYKPGKAPETPEQYRERLGTIAAAIAAEVERAEGWGFSKEALAAATLATWYAESRLSYEVHTGSGRTRHGEDQGRARCLGQVHRVWAPKGEWKRLAGTDLEATRRCAATTMKVLIAQSKRCRLKQEPGVWSLARVFAAYMNGLKCEPTKASLKRARHWAKLMKQLEEPQVGVAASGAAAPTTARLD